MFRSAAALFDTFHASLTELKHRCTQASIVDGHAAPSRHALILRQGTSCTAF